MVYGPFDSSFLFLYISIVSLRHSFFLKCIYLAASGVKLQHMGSSSLTKPQTRAPCIKSLASQPLDHQGSPLIPVCCSDVFSVFYHSTLLLIPKDIRRVHHEKCWAWWSTRFKIARRNNNNLRYEDDTTLMAESEEELNSFLLKVRE